jgi:hypothetical protein
MKTENICIKNNFNNNIRKVISAVALTFMFSNVNIDNNNQLSFTPVNVNARGKDIGSDDAGYIYISVYRYLCIHMNMYICISLNDTYRHVYIYTYMYRYMHINRCK